MQNDYPKEAPWGKATNSKLLAPGIVVFVTATHGGIWLSPEKNALVPDHLKETTFLKQGYEGWYEQDCDAQIVLTLFGPFDDT